jgi:hypothetical protein
VIKRDSYKLPHIGCGDIAQLDSRVTIINTLPQLPHHVMTIREIEQFWHRDCWKRVRGYDTVPGVEDQHIMHGSAQSLQHCWGIMPWKSLSLYMVVPYIHMMLLNPGIFQIYTRNLSTNLGYCCISENTPSRLPLGMYVGVVVVGHRFVHPNAD